ncbi:MULTISPECIES: phage tail tape measure protein [unclassified Wolbachia]|uniref:phage tail tape measure protein n=3 Tax=Wolbachia TaxID=953 RepID=UPI00110717D8|nr:MULTISPECIES: phage tail tape measure protein [unclassified Wolbachia]QVU16140.1 Phage tail tape measure protein [Wolbachia endosymbiont of Drosophila yakuba]QVU16240.1 Phage tail tape measure protein [Wolbachia endosymbiont of Drosophila yakuba]QVU17197.1 Phage tail tape measure protein [Wolbachia endosymbiont of Drosophila santomea]QVU17360.1 Phage tail tape measure protein [Wolbachia endosymbiont of Drosophila santomea]QWE32300.1 Phage tail tape measure protein [Wolbachia endosymbiont of
MSTLSIKIGAVLDGSFSTVIKGSSSQLTHLGENIRKLDSSLKSVSKFKQLGHDVLTSKRSWKGFEDQVKSLAKQMKAIEKPSKTLKAEFDKAKTSAIKAKEAYLKKRDALHSFNEEVRKSGRNIKYLVSDQHKLGSSIEVLKGKYGKLGSAIRSHQSFLASKAHFKSQIIETIGLGLTLAAPVKVAIDFESAMADVTKVVDFKKGTDEATKFAKKLKEMSRTIPLSAAELAQIAASGGQLGIKKEDLFMFTETVAKMSTAFDMSAEQAGDSIAKLSNVYGIDVSKMEYVGNVINHLSDNTAAKAKDMVEALAIVGGTAKQFGLDIKETSSLVNAFVSLGKQPAKAATAINALLSKLQTAEEQGGDFKAALEQMGITAEEIVQRISENGEEALLYFFQTLKKMDNQERSTILMKLFGQEYQDDIALLAGSFNKYEDAIRLLSDTEEYKSSLQKEFQNRVDTTASKLRLLRNAIAEVGMNLGSVMLPTLKSIAEFLQEKTRSIALFAEKYPTLTKAIMGTVAALISLKVVAVGLGYGFTLLGSTIFSLKANLLGVFSFLSATVFPAVVTGLRAVTLANPIGLLITGLVTGAALVITNWQKVKDFFSSFWKSIIKPIEEAFSWIGESIFGKVLGNSPLKEFEKRKTEVKAVHTPLKSNILNSGNPVLGNSIIKEFSKRNKNSFRVKSLIKETESDKIFARSKFENKEQNKTQNITNNYTISIKAEPNQDVRSLADEVIKRIREKSRDVLFDTVETFY